MASYGKYSANVHDFVNTSPMCNQEAGGPHHNNWFLCRGRSCAGPKTMTKPINDPTDLNLSNIFLGPAQDRPLQCHLGQSIPITGGNL